MNVLKRNHTFLGNSARGWTWSNWLQNKIANWVCAPGTINRTNEIIRKELFLDSNDQKAESSAEFFWTKQFLIQIEGSLRLRIPPIPRTIVPHPPNLPNFFIRTFSGCRNLFADSCLSSRYVGEPSHVSGILVVITAFAVGCTEVRFILHKANIHTEAGNGTVTTCRTGKSLTKSALKVFTGFATL